MCVSNVGLQGRQGRSQLSFGLRWWHCADEGSVCPPRMQTRSCLPSFSTAAISVGTKQVFGSVSIALSGSQDRGLLVSSVQAGKSPAVGCPLRAQLFEYPLKQAR